MSTDIAFGQVVLDAADPTSLAAFYSSLLDRPVSPNGNPFFAAIDGDGRSPGLMFIAVPEPRTGKNRVHVDFFSTDHRTAADRAVALGATKVGEFEEYGTAWVTLADPEGNLFDIGHPH